MKNKIIDEHVQLNVDEVCNKIIQAYSKEWLVSNKLPHFEEIVTIFILLDRNILTQALIKLKTYNVIEATNEQRYKLLERGYEVLSIGGWIKYLEFEKEKRSLVVEQIKSSIATDRSVSETNKIQKWFIYITILTTLCSIIIAYLTYNKVDNPTVFLLQKDITAQRTKLHQLGKYIVICQHNSDTNCCIDTNYKITVTRN